MSERQLGVPPRADSEAPAAVSVVGGVNMGHLIPLPQYRALPTEAAE